MAAKRALAVFAIGLVVGIGSLGTVRYLSYQPPEDGTTHYHANFAVFLNGERVDLSGPMYMEDVDRCKLDPSAAAPADRAHLHQGIHDVVHVHHKGVTWGHFFTNLRWTLGDDFIFTESGQRHTNEGERTLKFVIDGTPHQSVRNRVIRSTERLVISYGPESIEEVTQTQLPEVANTAEAFNLSHFDPGGCSGSGPPPPTTWERIRQAFFF